MSRNLSIVVVILLQLHYLHMFVQRTKPISNMRKRELTETLLIYKRVP